jgi:hypothetical protein
MIPRHIQFIYIWFLKYGYCVEDLKEDMDIRIRFYGPTVCQALELIETYQGDK